MGSTRCSWCGGANHQTMNFRTFCSRSCHQSFENWSVDRSFARKHAVHLWRTGKNRISIPEELVGTVFPTKIGMDRL